MGLETPNAGPIPYDLFIGRGWTEDFAFDGEDLSDVTDIRLGLTRKGRPRVQYDLIMTAGELVLGYVPLDGEEATGLEPDNAVFVRLPPVTTEDWVEGVYAFDIALTRGDGSIDTPIEGLVQIREPA